MTSGKKRVVILGGSSLLGKYLQGVTWIFSDLYEIVAKTRFSNPVYYHHWLDVTDADAVMHFVSRFKPHVIIDCAAIGSVDYCESHYGHAYRVNVTGVGNVMQAAKEYGAKVVFLSSNAVFRGDNPPYDEDSTREAINRYGAMKVAAENVVMSFPSTMWMIIRPILLFGWPWMGGRPNWVTIALDNMVHNRPMKIVDDTVTQPTYAKECARAIWQLIDMNATGTFHVAGANKCSLYDLVKNVAEVWGLKLLAEPVSSSCFTIAKRPVDTTYCTDKLKNCGIELAGIVDGLYDMKRENDLGSYIHS